MGPSPCKSILPTVTLSFSPVIVLPSLLNILTSLLTTGTKWAVWLLLYILPKPSWMHASSSFAKKSFILINLLFIYCLVGVLLCRLTAVQTYKIDKHVKMAEHIVVHVALGHHMLLMDILSCPILLQYASYICILYKEVICILS